MMVDKIDVVGTHKGRRNAAKANESVYYSTGDKRGEEERYRDEKEPHC